MIKVNSSPVVNPVLEVGQVSEQVEVQANAAMVETQNVGIGQVMENERILELPLNGRNAAELILSPPRERYVMVAGRVVAGLESSK